MFDIILRSKTEILLKGRLDASQAEKAKETFVKVAETCVVDFQDLEYISSAGMGILLMTQKRLSEKGNSLKFINVNKHIRDIFRYAGFDRIFEII